MYVLRIIIAGYLLPLCIGSLTSISGIALLFFSKKQRLGKILIITGLGFILVLSYTPLTNYGVTALERTHPQYHAGGAPVPYVVVLGAGHATDPEIPLSSQVSSAALTRLTEGIIIHRKNPGSKLIVSGYQGFDSIPHAMVMSRLARMLGVRDSDIIAEPRPRNTHEEALYIKDIVQDRPFVLVTSAAHMKRAYALFTHHHLKPIPAPTNYMGKKRIYNLFEFPNSGGLRNSEILFHEYVGMFWSWLNNEI